MADYNMVFVSGVATKDATLRRRDSGITKAEFSLEVERPFRRATGLPVSDLFLVDVYGPLAERCADIVREGTRLIVLGTLNKESYVARHGQREHMIVIKCKYVRVTEEEDIDFRYVSYDELRQDDWSDKMVVDYLDALIDAVDAIKRR